LLWFDVQHNRGVVGSTNSASPTFNHRAASGASGLEAASQAMGVSEQFEQIIGSGYTLLLASKQLTPLGEGCGPVELEI
jgi:predicted metal-dependent phosphoesterase TrpH